MAKKSLREARESTRGTVSDEKSLAVWRLEMLNKLCRTNDRQWPPEVKQFIATCGMKVGTEKLLRKALGFFVRTLSPS